MQKTRTVRQVSAHVDPDFDRWLGFTEDSAACAIIGGNMLLVVC